MDQQEKNKEQSLQMEKSFQEAKKAMNNAYAPYSGFFVGACLRAKGKDLYFSGCNVENASYGGTICAERNALTTMISSVGKQDIESIVVVGKTEAPLPCAICLQMLSEFSAPDVPVYLYDMEGLKKKYLFKDLLPHPFNLK